MGMKVEVYSYKFVGILSKIYEITGKYDVEGTTKLLEHYGDIVDTRFILLRNDFWEEGSPYDLLCSKLDELYGDNTAYQILSIYAKDEKIDAKELKNYIEDDFDAS